MQLFKVGSLVKQGDAEVTPVKDTAGSEEQGVGRSQDSSKSVLNLNMKVQTHTFIKMKMIGKTLMQVIKPVFEKLTTFLETHFPF